MNNSVHHLQRSKICLVLSRLKFSRSADTTVQAVFAANTVDEAMSDGSQYRGRSGSGWGSVTAPTKPEHWGSMMDSNLASKMARCFSIMLAFAALALRWMFCCAMMFCAVNVLVCYRHIDPFWAIVLFSDSQAQQAKRTGAPSL